MQRPAVVWFPSELQSQCHVEGKSKFPRETGGVLMGYWNGPAYAVITAAIGPGPAAIHERYLFEPDYQWQLSAIAAHYEGSGRRETYIGDWHTHPGAATPHLSRDDLRTLRQVINTPAARAPMPLMAIFYGERDAWALAIWRACLVRRWFPWRKLVTDRANIRER